MSPGDELTERDAAAVEAVDEFIVPKGVIGSTVFKRFTPTAASKV